MLHRILLALTLVCPVLVFAQTSSTNNTLGTTGITAIQSTTNAGYKLSVGGAVKLFGTGFNVVGSPTLYLQNSTATTGRHFGLTSTNNGLFQVFDITASNTVRFSINNSGFIGIGAGTATSMFSLGNNTANSKLAVFDDGTSLRSGFGWASGQMRLHLSAATDKFSFLASEGAGTDLMTILGSGKVGIGTNSPGTTLEVAGSFKTGGVAYPVADGLAGQVLTTNGAGVASWSTVSSGSGSQWTTSGTDIFNANTGNVAIGTSTINPSYKLEIAGAAHSNYGFYANGTANSGFYLGNTNEAYYHYGPNQTRISGGYAEYIDFGGPYGNRITLHANESVFDGLSYHLGGIKTTLITPVNFLATFGSTASNPDIGVKVSSNYVNNGAGGPNYGATMAIGDANINTAAGVTNEISALLINPTVNTSGGTTKVRGLLYNPTLTSTAGLTNVAIETVTGNTILGSASGNTLIGTATDAGQRLQVEGTTYSKYFTNSTTPLGGVYDGALRLRIGSAGGSYIDFYNELNTNRKSAIMSPGDSRRLSIYDAVGVTFGTTDNVTIGTENGMWDGAKLSVANPVNSTATAFTVGRDDPNTPIVDFTIKSSGNIVVGGTTDNGKKFQVNGDVWTTGLVIPTNAQDGYVLTSNANGKAEWKQAAGGTGGTGGTNFWTASGTNIVNSNGGVVVIGAVPPSLGTINDADLRLAVNGNVYTKKVKVTATAWSDYVFDTTYRLRPLSEVEAFIKANQHLPEVPSTAEVTKSGVDVGDTQALLLKKVEELTLYMIELNKRIDQQQTLINAQQKKIETLSAQKKSKK